jgi:hypothetical protein
VFVREASAMSGRLREDIASHLLVPAARGLSRSEVGWADSRDQRESREVRSIAGHQWQHELLVR